MYQPIDIVNPLITVVYVYVYVYVLQSVEWQDSNICSKCQTPFFWNIKGMWHMKKIGRRQVVNLVCH